MSIIFTTIMKAISFLPSDSQVAFPPRVHSPSEDRPTCYLKTERTVTIMLNELSKILIVKETQWSLTSKFIIKAAKMPKNASVVAVVSFSPKNFTVSRNSLLDFSCKLSSSFSSPSVSSIILWKIKIKRKGFSTHWLNIIGPLKREKLRSVLHKACLK